MPRQGSRVDQSLEILLAARVPGVSRARIEGVEVRLDRLERFGDRDLTHRRAVASSREANMAGQASRFDRLECCRHLTQYRPQVERPAVTLRQTQRIVQVKDVHVGATQALQARLQRLTYRGAGPARLTWWQTDLGAHHHLLPRAKLAHDATQVLFGCAVTVQSGRVEIGNTRVQRPRDSLALILGRPAHHQSADSTTPETKRRDTQTG